MCDWIDICESDEHPLKAPFPILFTKEGINICVNDKHPAKTFSLIEVMVEGSV